MLLATVLLVAVIFLSCITGVSFRLWPTSFNDSTLQITQQKIEQLKKLQAERKFLPDKNTFYPGAPNEIIRSEAENGIDALISSLLIDLPHKPKRSVVLAAFKMALPTFAYLDSEEKDQILVYFERIMSIVGVTQSGELLNVWRYGFPYGWFAKP